MQVRVAMRPFCFPLMKSEKGKHLDPITFRSMVGPNGRWIIYRTGQKWKIGISMLFFVFAVAIHIHQLFTEGKNFIFSSLFWLTAGLVCFGAAFAFLTIRCPKCQAHWAWMAAREQPHRSAGDWFIMLDKCPKCGYEGKDQR